MKNSRYSLMSLFTVLGLTLATPALAGGPLANCASGQPYLWPNGGTNITFNPDQGNLGPVSGPDAIALVAQGFQAWEDIPSSTLTYQAGALLPVDVDITNFGPYLNATAPDGLSAVVFDDDGAIFDLLFGAGSGILGFAGPEWGTPAACTIDEGLSFLNGPSFTNATAALDVMVHEFGHWTNFAHTVVNGQIYIGDTSGPTPFGSFDPVRDPFASDIVETMYPFYFGPGIGTATLEADDVAIASRMYPEPDYSATTGTISGEILAGTQRITGVNVIARNLANPYADAVSAISSDFTDGLSQADPNVGVYTITGLTPGADYAVYVDEVLAGGFSTPLATPLPGPEEFYSGASESSDPNVDDPSVFAPVAAVAGGVSAGVDIIFNQPGEGDPLPVGDDGNVRLGLPFTYEICGQSFGDVYVNANGNLTFGAPSSDFSESAADMLNGPPRIAGLWDDLNPNQGGAVFYTTTNNTFTVTWDAVPQFFNNDANTFSIELKKSASQATVTYGDLGATDGLAGVSCGAALTGGVEGQTPIRQRPKSTTHNFNGNTAIYEVFSSSNPNDLANYGVKYNTTKHDLDDVFEPNNSIAAAAAVTTPLNTAPNELFTEISPAAADIDFYSFEGEVGQYLIAETVRGQVDTVLGLFDSAGNLIAGDDDGGAGLLSRIEGGLPYTGTYYLAVTFCCDYDFDGVDPGQGPPFDEGRYVLDLQVLDGLPLPLGDDTSLQLSGFGFAIPFAGTDYTSVFVNANGNVTFGAPSTDFSESVGDFLGGPARAAPLWDDLNPSAGGLVLASSDFATELTITWVDVPEFFASGANNFSVTLFSDGTVNFDYGSVTASDALIGATPGGGALGTPVDLSAVGGGKVSESVHELFNFSSPYDLGNPDALTFTPD